MSFLAEVRVLDLTDERGAFAGHLFAQLGADVVMAEPPEGARIRHRPPFAGDVPGPERSLVHQVLNRGKRSVVVPRSELLSLAPHVDVVLTSGGPAELRAAGIPHPSDWRSERPELVVANISGFGLTGPKADWLDGDLVCGAAGFQTTMTGDADRPPLRCAVPQVFASACGDAVVGTLLALRERRTSGFGQVVDAAAQDSWLWAAFYLPYYELWGNPVPSRNGATARMGAVTPRLEFPAADGAVTIMLVFGSAVGPFTNRFVAWMAEEGECSAEIAAQDWSQYDFRVDPEPHQRLNAAAVAFTARRTKAELLAEARRRRLLLAPAWSLDEVLAADQFRARDLWRPLDGEGTGGAVVPGALARCEPPLVELAPAPRLGTTSIDEIRDRTPVVAVAPRPAGSSAERTAPLAGVKVLDLTTSFAGPHIGRILATFGAQVVKVESEARPDYARSTGPFLKEGLDGGASYVHTNACKWSVALDLSQPESRPVLHDLVRWADVVIDAYAPGALARMSLDRETLQSLNPSLILLHSSLLGQTGPMSDMPGYGNMAGALCGFFTTTAWPGRLPVGLTGAYTDFVSPRFGASLVLAALEHRRRTGEGVVLDMGQGEASMHLLALGIADQQVNGRSWEHRGNADWFASPHVIAPSAGDDRWVAVVCDTDEHWAALAGVLGRPDLAGLTVEQRLDRAEELEHLVASWTGVRTDAEAQEVLQAAGVPAHRAQSCPELATDPQLTHRGWIATVHHPLIGPLPIGTTSIRLSGTPARLEQGGPMLGEHTMPVLTDLLGYDDERVTSLVLSGALR